MVEKKQMDSEIQCMECGEECHCNSESCQCTHCNCVNIAMDRDGSAQVNNADKT